jgi:hypothetical protein
MAQQPVRVVVEKKPSGCWSVFGVLLLIGLAIEYWYVSLGMLLLVVVAVAIGQFKQKQRQQLKQDKARRRPGPRDPWLNEVAIGLADLGLIERARNTCSEIGGVPIEGDIALDAEEVSLVVTLFATDEFARQASLALRAKPDVRTAESNGHTAIKTRGRVLYTANGRGGIVDEFRFDEAVRVTDKLSLPAPLRHQSTPGATPLPVRTGLPGEPSVAQLRAPEADAVEQIRKLGELRTAGMLTEAEFAAKKAELLRRI